MQSEGLDTVKTAGSGLGVPVVGRRYLAVFEPQSSRVVPLPERGQLVVGRGEEAGLKLDDVKVSRRHIVLELAPETVTVHDLASQNGTFVNGERLQEARAIASGAVVEIGRSALVLHAASGQRAAADAAFRELEIGEARLVVADSLMQRLYALIERLAAADLPVLITGETGAGKELAVRALHHFSPRTRQRLVAINCAALQETLVESELFGHQKGAFTGATCTKMGLLEAAAGGTAFLDEVGELPLAVQAKLLRALDTKRIVRVGDVHERPIDVRIVAATHRDLEREVAEGRFRQDLFFRLGGATLWVPPLRDRPRELVILAQRFLGEARARLQRSPMALSDEALRALAAHPWPGNVRELKNVMEYCAAAFDDPVLEAWHVAERLAAIAEPTRAPRSLQDEIRELERQRMREALEQSGGNQRRAAEIIGMPLRTFVTKLAQHGLRRR